ncbi:hypothetical protein DM02DRAFT_662141 [Periconia macrospinosa]|uniref:Uncharacterized protein n=1 Tax=Periconia macrospinosa TaxID=97972 RepID=A0A2V1D5D9_9PLEO|nr:hypothetical protein DM02DRAFT_662141 [Periconia macrospinosa]
MGFENTFCAICGAPMLDGGYMLNENERWLNDAILLTTAHPNDQGIMELDEYWPSPPFGGYSYSLGPYPPSDDVREVLRLRASANGPRFVLEESGDTVTAMVVEIENLKPALSHGGSLYLPMHHFCLAIADRYIQSHSTLLHTTQTSHANGIKCNMSLWNVLYKRLRGKRHEVCNTLPSPQDYYGGRLYRNVYYEPGDDSITAALHRKNPMHIPRLTESLLENLAPMDRNDHRFHSQDWYRQVLCNGEIFPWLWDLDLRAIESKEASGAWDWSRLAFSLANSHIQEPSDTSLQLDGQLRNRRRIWRILSEAWEGDISLKQDELNEARKRR